MLFMTKIYKPACANAHCHNYSSWCLSGFLHKAKAQKTELIMKGSDNVIF